MVIVLLIMIKVVVTLILHSAGADFLFVDEWLVGRYLKLCEYDVFGFCSGGDCFRDSLVTFPGWPQTKDPAKAFQVLRLQVYLLLKIIRNTFRPSEKLQKNILTSCVPSSQKPCGTTAYRNCEIVKIRKLTLVKLS